MGNQLNIHKLLLAILGIILVALAIVGIFLPLLPTTPFLLLALACFSKSSDRLHNWLIEHNTLGPLIRHWHETRSMPRKAKVIAICAIALTGGVSLYCIDTLKLKLILIALLIIPVVIILKIRTTKSTEADPPIN